MRSQPTLSCSILMHQSLCSTLAWVDVWCVDKLFYVDGSCAAFWCIFQGTMRDLSKNPPAATQNALSETKEGVSSLVVAEKKKHSLSSL